MNNLFRTGMILLVFAIVSGFGVTNFSDKIEVDKDRIEITFNRTLDFNDLVKIRQDLSEKGISLDCKLLEFDDNDGLMSMFFKVDCNDGFSGAATNPNINNNTKFGFYRDYSENTGSPLGTGGLE